MSKQTTAGILSLIIVVSLSAAIAMWKDDIFDFTVLKLPLLAEALIYAASYYLCLQRGKKSIPAAIAISTVVTVISLPLAILIEFIFIIHSGFLSNLTL